MANKKFDALQGRDREFVLMETAMRIQEIFDDMAYAQMLNPDKMDAIDQIARLAIFCGWAEIFLKRYFGTEDYEDMLIDTMDEFATKRLEKTFG